MKMDVTKYLHLHTLCRMSHGVIAFTERWCPVCKLCSDYLRLVEDVVLSAEQAEVDAEVTISPEMRATVRNAMTSALLPHISPAQY